MAGYVVAFVGENANGILEWWTAEILKELERAGFETRLIDCLKPNWTDALAAALNGKRPTFGFGLQGMGAGIALKGENIWAKLDVPFFSYMGDSPYHCPRLHWQPAPRTFLLYSCQDFFDTYCKYIKGPAAALLHPYGFPVNPHARDTAWREREIDIVYVKTGVDPVRFRAVWDTFPKPLRAIAHDTAEIALAGSDETIADICAARFAAENFTWGERRELFCSLCSHIDLYVRASRATKMARLLMKLPAHIYGDGWEFLDRSESRATFHPNIPADQLLPLYAKAKILANVTPSVRHGMHERVMAGLLSRAAVLSDVTPYTRSALTDYPAFLGADVDSPDFEEQAMQRLCLPEAMDDLLEESYRKACAELSLPAFVEPLLDRLKLNDFEERAAGFRIV